MRLAAPTMAAEHSPALRLWQARCTATKDDEHAVSMVRLGPLRSSAYEMRPEAAYRPVPVVEYRSTSACGGAASRS
jgi:hypothetical protein